MSVKNPSIMGKPPVNMSIGSGMKTNSKNKTVIAKMIFFFIFFIQSPQAWETKHCHELSPQIRH